MGCAAVYITVVGKSRKGQGSRSHPKKTKAKRPGNPPSHLAKQDEASTSIEAVGVHLIESHAMRS